MTDEYSDDSDSIINAGLIDPSNSIAVNHTCDPSHDSTTDRVA